jgi:1-phosphofructokinase
VSGLGVVGHGYTPRVPDLTDANDHDGELPAEAARACVIAPAPLLTITIERAVDDTDDIHVHAGGQGFWVARMLRQLGVHVTLCGTFGGEPGPLVRHTIEDAGIAVRAVAAAGGNGVYIHDRRSGSREVVAESHPPPLTRHESDELYGSVLGEALDTQVCVLAGPGSDGVVSADMYGRLATDMRVAGIPTIADLSGERLEAVLQAGVFVLKVSDEELVRDGMLDEGTGGAAGADGADPTAVIVAVRQLARAGAENVILTRGHDPALALLDGELYEVRVPRLEPVETRGAGDSLTAGVAAGVVRGLPLTEAVRLGAAAGGLNVTRHGLGTGTQQDIERLVRLVELHPLESVGLDPSMP